ncbi:hypothetical protein ENSA5_40890 [Enhygromyxa salina]|uniref:SCP domain-containing protein n=1 Tax=Enhygromyxa salina TaxID=215803 RepID=A0A2S9XP08_9BACT|nr:CAP domain-containing protein [Enhygromyxa salina]PRP94470.1 hypothetical protein ENSA5_40890 [Enhygromyxa salina]
MRRTWWLLSVATSLACYQGVGDFGDSLGTETGVGLSNGDLGDGDPGDGDSGDGDPGDGDPGDGDSGDGDGDSGDGDGDSGDGDSGDGDGGPGDGDSGDGDGDSQSVCERWNSDRADLSEGNWSGSVNGCNAGDMDAAWRERSLRQINLYRWLADLPPVTTSADRNAKAQACALMMDANDALSHSPPMNWTCWSAEGSQGAGSSNIAGTAAVTAVDLYMVDYGNASTMGHRRWILSNSLGPTGIGSSDTYSCMWTIGGNGNAGKQWTAWPPPGEFPAEAINPLWWGEGLDETGWTIQSDELNLGGAEVSVTVDGQDRPVSITNLSSGYGSTSAITLIPMGWSAEAGTTYHVEVSGAGAPISYDVEIVDC